MAVFRTALYSLFGMFYITVRNSYSSNVKANIIKKIRCCWV